MSILVYIENRDGKFSKGAFELVSFVSAVMTLVPGDIIVTGTPPGVGPIVPGDTVEVEIEGIGILKNKVAKTH